MKRATTNRRRPVMAASFCAGVVDAIDDVRSAFGAIGTTLADC